MKKNRKLAITALIVIIIIGLVFYLAKDSVRDRFFGPTDSSLQDGVKTEGNKADIEVVAENLTVPWEVAFFPGGDLLVTERSGTLQRIGKNQQTHTVEGVVHVGEGGLLGLALHPRFSDNGWLYLYMTTRSGEGLTNRIERYTYRNDQLTERKVILQNIPGASNHDGGRLAFGSDGYLYATTGDAGNENSAQNTSSLAGKILRMDDEGRAPADNPFGNLVYSYGHRNSQGLAWDEQDRLWSSEHGRSGLQSGYDELNLIKKGSNYGWPIIQGDEQRQGMERPIAHSGPSETWAPASLAHLDGSLFFGGLRGQALYEAKLNGTNSVSITAHFRQEYGRLRAVTMSPDNFLYLTTSNTDGRGNPNPGDDKVIRVNPQVFR